MLPKLSTSTDALPTATVQPLTCVQNPRVAARASSHPVGNPEPPQSLQNL